MSTSGKLKFALNWFASCGGCEVAVLDTDEKILDIAALADIILWPVAVDGKYKDIENIDDDEIDVAFINGGIRNSENLHIAKLLRRKSKVVIAFGSCACFGGIPGLANLASREEIFDRVYNSCPSVGNPGEITPQQYYKIPEGELELPEFFEKLRSLDEVIRVDYFLPGCPPAVEWIGKAIEAIATNTLPPLGSTLALNTTLCKECEQEISDEKKITKFKRVYEIVPDTTKCLLEQGIICCGPVTRGGCSARCLGANMPCKGCYGPSPEVLEQGAKMISLLGSVIDSLSPYEIVKTVKEGIRDPVGVFLQYTLPKSILKGRKLT